MKCPNSFKKNRPKIIQSQLYYSAKYMVEFSSFLRQPVLSSVSRFLSFFDRKTALNCEFELFLNATRFLSTTQQKCSALNCRVVSDTGLCYSGRFSAPSRRKNGE